jgi:hypothetical protein
MTAIGAGRDGLSAVVGASSRLTRPPKSATIPAGPLMLLPLTLAKPYQTATPRILSIVRISVPDEQVSCSSCVAPHEDTHMAASTPTFEQVFFAKLHAYNVPHVNFVDAPQCFEPFLLNRAKRHARLLEMHLPAIPHRAMLEKVAIAAGFPHWHAIQQTLKGFADAHGKAVAALRVEPFFAFEGALALMITVPAEVGPNVAQRGGLLDFAHRLAETIPAQVEPVLEALAAVHGGASWADFVAIRPEGSEHPLYRFHVEEEGNGYFVWSAACTALVDELDVLFQGYDSRPQAERRRARRFALATVDKRPDFLEGHLAAANILEFDDEFAASQYFYEQGVKRAEALIPKGFKGEIPWAGIENRFYHRLLFNLMRWYCLADRADKAIPLARRQLRRNKTDNLGVRYLLPVLLAAEAQFHPTDLALKRLRDEIETGDAQALLTASLCRFAQHQDLGALKYFLLALFQYPGLRLLVEGDLTEDPYNAGWHRGGMPDLELMALNLLVIDQACPRVDPMLQTILKHPDVMAAEKRLAGLYGDVKKEKDKGNPVTMALRQWETALQQTAQTLSLPLLTHAIQHEQASVDR